MNGAESCTASAKPRPTAFDERRGIPRARDSGRRQEGVAVADRHGREVMEVEGEDQRQPEEREEVPDRRLLASHGGVHRHRKSEPELLSDDVAGRLQSSDHHPGRKPEHEADCELAREQKEQRSRSASSRSGAPERDLHPLGRRRASRAQHWCARPRRRARRPCRPG